MANIPKPITRKDKYYYYLINGSGALPKPITREDRYLYYLCTNGFGGGGTVTPEMVDAAVDAALKLAKEYTDDAVSNAGYSLGLSIDSDYIMTLELKNADDKVVSTKSIDFPIESMVVGASYAEGVVTLSLQNGNEIDVDVSDLVKGLVSDNFTIAGIDMKDAITAKELKEALAVTAKDVGALPLTGGEMQGNISFESLEGDYKILKPKNIQMKYEGTIDVNGGYIDRVEEINFEGGTKPVRSDAILTTKEQINANTDTEKVAGATAVKDMVSEINGSLFNKLKIVKILNEDARNVDIEYTPVNKANAFTYFIPILLWRQGSIVAKRYYDDTYDAVTTDIISTNVNICVVRHAVFLINRTTGAVKVKEINQSNLQSDGNFTFSTETMDGVGLLGINQ